MRENNPQHKLPEGGEPLSETINRLHEGPYWVYKDFAAFDEALAKNDHWTMKEYARLCLKDFLTFMKDLESSVEHPRDFDVIFKDKEIREFMIKFLENVKKYNFINIAKDDLEEEKIFEEVKNCLLKAEIYFAPQ